MISDFYMTAFVSMDNGPVDLDNLNYINGLEADSQLWDRYVTSRKGHYIGISNPHLTTNDLDELSAADIFESWMISSSNSMGTKIALS